MGKSGKRAGKATGSQGSDTPTTVTVVASLPLDLTLKGGIFGFDFAELRLRGHVGHCDGDEPGASAQPSVVNLFDAWMLPVAWYAFALRTQLALIDAAFAWAHGVRDRS